MTTKMFMHHDNLDAISGQEQAFPIGDATSGTLRFTRGASNVTLRTAPEPSRLCRLLFTGRQPDVRHDGAGEITIAYPRAFHPLDWRKHAVNGTLTDAIPWTLEIRGGLAHLDADLASLRLQELVVHGGASNVQIVLPAPVGVIPVRIDGGASQMDIARPAGVTVKLDIGGGASPVRIDDQRFGAMAGPTSLAGGANAGSPDRYEITIAGGASQLTIREDERPR
jgi:hypothetical protein